MRECIVWLQFVTIDSATAHAMKRNEVGEDATWLEGTAVHLALGLELA